MKVIELIHLKRDRSRCIGRELAEQHRAQETEVARQVKAGNQALLLSQKRREGNGDIRPANLAHSLPRYSMERIRQLAAFAMSIQIARRLAWSSSMCKSPGPIDRPTQTPEVSCDRALLFSSSLQPTASSL